MGQLSMCVYEQEGGGEGEDGNGNSGDPVGRGISG